MPFFSTLSYSSCNEDWRTERRALRVGPGDRALAITGGGDRPMHLLLDDPASVTAVDANPAQSALLALKLAALQALPFDEYAAFLGLEPATDRVARLEALRPGLPDDAAGFFDRERAAVARGVLYAGRWERHYARVARVGRALRGASIRRLFAFDDLDAQRAWVHEVWDRGWWRLVFDAMCSRTLSRMVLRDPAFYAHVDPDFDIGAYVYEGMRASLGRHLARENFMLSLVLLGRLAAEDLPPYLVREHAATIRARASRIARVTADLVTFLEQVPPASFTRLSLSDVPSYLDASTFERLLAAVARAAAPGARFCIRLFLTSHEIPERLQGTFVREPALEEELRADDRAFAYRFLVGTVRPSETRGAAA